MTPSRRHSLIEGLQSFVRKVFDAVPISEHWTLTQIEREVIRTGASMGRARLEFAVCQLVKMGLVSEGPPHHFKRVPEKEDTPPPTERKPQIVSTNPPAPAEPATPHDQPALDVLGRLADRARRLARDFNTLADDIDLTAITIADREKRNHADMQKLRQLQELLQTIGSTK